VYLRVDPAQPQRPLDYMKLELDRLMRTGIEWRDARAPERESTDAPLVFVELRGACGAPIGSPLHEPLSEKLNSLASTSTSGGDILPFSSVNCAALTRTLSVGLATEPAARRDFLYGRAVARLLAHELYHVLLKTGDHAREGIGRPGFTPNDLLTERFEFEQTTLAKLRAPATRSLPSRTASSESPAR
jgi:hypothetical protein